jgi:hypothetical protein
VSAVGQGAEIMSETVKRAQCLFCFSVEMMTTLLSNFQMEK